MIKVGLGQAEGIDTLKTVNEVISKCEQQLRGVIPQAGIVLAANTFDHHRMLTEIHARFPHIELIGCTTSGEFSSNYGFSDDSIILMTFYSDDLEIQAGVGRDLSVNPLASVQTAVSQARQNLTLSPRLGLAFPDGFDKILRERTGQCELPPQAGRGGEVWAPPPAGPSAVQFSLLRQTLEELLACGERFALSLDAGLLVVLALLDLGQNSRFLALALETP